MTLLNAALYDLTQETQGAFFMAGMTAYNRSLQQPEDPPHPLLQVLRGYAESAGWLLVQANEFDPEPLTVEKLRVRAVWSSEGIMRGILELMAAQKWFDRMGEDYHLTEIGRTVVQQRRERMANILSCAEPLPMSDLKRLDNLLYRIINASLESSETWCLAHSRNRAPAADAHIMVKLSAHCSDFNAFRDDAHMAAFRQHNIPAFAWEALSFIDNDTANTPESLFDQLHYRGYSRRDFAQALAELAERGWVTLIGNRASITKTGKHVREEAERLTDDYFYAPWSVLSSDEISEVETLLLALHEASNAMMENG